MMQTSTQLDMIAYLYGEASPTQVKNTEAAMAGDPVVRHELTEMVQSRAQLPRVAFNTPRRILNAVKRYAKPNPTICPA